MNNNNKNYMTPGILKSPLQGERLTNRMDSFYG